MSSPRPHQVWVRYWPQEYAGEEEARILAVDDDALTIIIHVRPETWDIKLFYNCFTYARDEATIWDRLESGEHFRLKPEPTPRYRTLEQMAIDEIKAEEDQRIFGMCDLAIEELKAPAAPEPPDVWDRLREEDNGGLV